MFENNTTTVRTVVNAVRYEVKGQAAWDEFVREFGITKDTVADAAKELATMAFPKEEPVQKRDGKRTTFGNAVQAAGYNIREALKRAAGDDETDDDSETVVNLLTRAGLKAELGDVIAAWKAAHENN